MIGQEVWMLLLWNITRTTSEISLLKSLGRIIEHISPFDGKIAHVVPLLVVQWIRAR